MMNFRPVCFLVLVGVFFSGCGVKVAPVTEPVVLPEFVTATLPPTLAPVPTSTPLPPTVAPTMPPVEGKTTTEVNVRAEPSTASESFGVVAAFSAVQVVGKDASGKWFAVLFADSPNGVGWVRAEYVQVAASAEIPVREVEAGSGAVGGVVIRGVNVRSGPGQDFESLGLLVESDVVSILGRDSSGSWLQIRFAGSPDGKGWVAADYLQVVNASELPVVGEAVATAGTEVVETPSGTVSTLATAPADGDSAESPLVMAALTFGDLRAVQIVGQVSWPDGDTEDWVAFSSQGAEVRLRVGCEAGGLDISLLEGGQVVEGFTAVCGNEFEMKVFANRGYVLRLSASPGEAALVRYILKMQVLD